MLLGDVHGELSAHQRHCPTRLVTFEDLQIDVFGRLLVPSCGIVQLGQKRLFLVSPETAVLLKLLLTVPRGLGHRFGVMCDDLVHLGHHRLDHGLLLVLDLDGELTQLGTILAELLKDRVAQALHVVGADRRLALQPVTFLPGVAIPLPGILDQVPPLLIPLKAEAGHHEFEQLGSPGAELLTLLTEASQSRHRGGYGVLGVSDEFVMLVVPVLDARIDLRRCGRSTGWPGAAGAVVDQIAQSRDIHVCELVSPLGRPVAVIDHTE